MRNEADTFPHFRAQLDRFGKPCDFLASLPNFSDKRQGAAWIVPGDEITDLLKVKLGNRRKSASPVFAHDCCSSIA